MVRENELRGMKIEALRNLLKKRGLNTFGRKYSGICNHVAFTILLRDDTRHAKLLYSLVCMPVFYAGRKEDLISRLMAATFRNRTEKQPR